MTKINVFFFILKVLYLLITACDLCKTIFMAAAYGSCLHLNIFKS